MAHIPGSSSMPLSSKVHAHEIGITSALLYRSDLRHEQSKAILTHKNAATENNSIAACFRAGSGEIQQSVTSVSHQDRERG